MAFIRDESRGASERLADERGPFPEWEDSILEEPSRNATTTTIAPTGTISLIAGCSASIEPIYNVAYTKQVMGTRDCQRPVRRARERARVLCRGAHERPLRSDHDPERRGGSRRREAAVSHGPRRARRRPPSYPGGVPGARRQRGEQNDKPAPIGVRRGRKDVFLTARELEVKGITVFRSGAKSEQVLGETPRKEECAGECDYVAVDGGLPDPRY